MKTPLSHEHFEAKIDALILAAVEVVALKAPDGILNAIDKLVALRRELIAHDAAMRAGQPEAPPFELDEPEIEAALNSMVAADERKESLRVLPGTRHHSIGCRLANDHAGLCSIGEAKR